MCMIMYPLCIHYVSMRVSFFDGLKLRFILAHEQTQAQRHSGKVWDLSNECNQDWKTVKDSESATKFWLRSYMTLVNAFLFTLLSSMPFSMPELAETCSNNAVPRPTCDKIDNMWQYPDISRRFASRTRRYHTCFSHCHAMHCDVTVFTPNLRPWWILMDSYGFLKHLCIARNWYPKKYWSHRIEYCHISLHSKDENQLRYDLCATTIWIQ